MTVEIIPRRMQLLLELTLLSTVIIGWVFVLRHFFSNGYLPPPFVYDTLDDFMDWYNPAYWAHNYGAYPIYKSVYPPLTFIIMSVFSDPNCYTINPFHARSCDHSGIILLVAAFIANVIITIRAFRIHPPSIAVTRGLAVSLGLPMVMALDRGNVIVLAYFFFVLGVGRVLRQSWATAASLAVVINLKVYLVVILAAPFLKRKWRFCERAIVATILLYLTTWVIFGSGSPKDLIGAITGFSTYFSTPGNQPYSGVFYGASYFPLYRFVSVDLPLTQFVGSRWMEVISIVPIVLLHAGQICVLVTFLCALWRPADIPLSRLVAQSIGLVMITTEIGGYSEVFMLFPLFLETRRSIPIWIAFVTGYLLCIPIDHMAYHVQSQSQSAYLSGRQVDYEMGVSYGMFIRPGLNIIIQYALAAASIVDVIRAMHIRRSEPRLALYGARA